MNHTDISLPFFSSLGQPIPTPRPSFEEDAYFARPVDCGLAKRL